MLLPTPHTVMLREMEFLGSTGMGNFALFPGKSYSSEDTFFFQNPFLCLRAQGSSLSENLGGRDTPV